MSESREFTVVSSGTSMFPLIRDGMIVTLRRVPAAEIAVGDIVAFPGDGRTILHRIVRKRGDRWLEKGDNRRVGSWIDPGTIVGKAVQCEDASLIRSLDVSASSPRVRLIAGLSRAESATFTFFSRAARTVVRGKSGSPALNIMGRIASALTAPLRFIVGPPLLSVYPSRPRVEDEKDLAELVRYFRDVHGAPPDGIDGLLASHGLEAIAADQREGGKQVRYRGAFLFVNAVATLRDVQRVMTTNQISYAILKGPPLAQALYGDGSLRASVDLDVLVESRERDRAAAALEAAGFRARGTNLQQAAVKRGHFHLVFDPPQKNRLTVELHWALVDRANLYRMDEAEIRGRWTSFVMEDFEVGVLSREDEFLYLLLHIAKHGLFNGYGLKRGEPATWFCRAAAGNRLIWFLDVQKFLEKFGDSLNWAALLESSNRWNILDAIFQSLEVLDRLRPDSVAATALERLGHERGRVGASKTVSSPSSTWTLRLMRANKNLVIRPARLLTLGNLLFPTRNQLKNFYRDSACPVLILRIGHPFRMLVRLVRG